MLLLLLGAGRNPVLCLTAVICVYVMNPDDGTQSKEVSLHESKASMCEEGSSLFEEKTLCEEKASLCEEKTSLCEEKTSLSEEKAVLCDEKTLCEEDASLCEEKTLCEEKPSLSDEKIRLCEEKRVSARPRHHLYSLKWSLVLSIVLIFSILSALFVVRINYNFWKGCKSLKYLYWPLFMTWSLIKLLVKSL